MAMSAMGLDLNTEEMSILFEEFDMNGKQSISVVDFMTMVNECLNGSDTSSHDTVSVWSSDSTTLRKHPMILQVRLLCMSMHSELFSHAYALSVRQAVYFHLILC